MEAPQKQILISALRSQSRILDCLFIGHPGSYQYIQKQKKETEALIKLLEKEKANG